MYINNTQTHTHTHTQEQKKEVLGKVQWASESQTVVRFSGGGLAGSRKPVQAITVPWWTPWYHLLWDSVSLGATMESTNVWWTPISKRQWLVLWSYTGDQVKVLTSTSFQPRQVMNTEVWPKPHQWATSTTPISWVTRGHIEDESIEFSLHYWLRHWVEKWEKYQSGKWKEADFHQQTCSQRMRWRGEALVLCMSWLTGIFQILFAQGDNRKKQCRATFLKVNTQCNFASL